jgi:hypothetical protein
LIFGTVVRTQLLRNVSHERTLNKGVRGAAVFTTRFRKYPLVRTFFSRHQILHKAFFYIVTHKSQLCLGQILALRDSHKPGSNFQMPPLFQVKCSPFQLEITLSLAIVVILYDFSDISHDKIQQIIDVAILQRRSAK